MLIYFLLSVRWLVVARRRSENNVEPKMLKWLFLFLAVNLVFLIFYFLVSASIIPFYIGISILFSLVVILFSTISLSNPTV